MNNFHFQKSSYIDCSVYDSITVENNVFIVSLRVFTNDYTLRNVYFLESVNFKKIFINKVASNIVNVAIKYEITIGENLMTGDEIFCAKDIFDNVLKYSNPLIIKSCIDKYENIFRPEYKYFLIQKCEAAA